MSGPALGNKSSVTKHPLCQHPPASASCPLSTRSYDQMSVSTECSFQTESDWQPPSESASLNSFDMDLPHSPTSPRNLLKVGSDPSARSNVTQVSGLRCERGIGFGSADSAAPYIRPEPCYRCVWVSAPVCVCAHARACTYFSKVEPIWATICGHELLPVLLCFISQCRPSLSSRLLCC